MENLNSSNINNSTCVLNYCPSPYFSDSVQCQLCAPGCSVCQIDGMCFVCQTGFIKAADSGICIVAGCNSTSQLFISASSSCGVCSTTCLSCISSPTNCSSCPRSSNISSQTYYYNYSCVSQCPNGYFAHQTSFSCRKCNPKCLICSNFYNCLNCTAPFSLLNFYDLTQGQCVA